jgi:hypothetical protein
MATDIEAAVGKKGKRWPVWAIVLVTLGVAGVLGYLMWPKSCVHVKADVKYNPVTGEKLDSSTVTVNPVTGVKFTA